MRLNGEQSDTFASPGLSHEKTLQKRAQQSQTVLRFDKVQKSTTKMRNLNVNSNISHQIILRFNDLNWYQCWFYSSVLLQHVNNWLICVFLFFLNYFSPSHRPWHHWRSWQSSVLSSCEGAGLPPACQQSAWQLQWSVRSDTLAPVNQSEHQNIKSFLELPHCLLLR